MNRQPTESEVLSTMEDDEFKEHVKVLKRKYAETVHEIQKYTVKNIDDSTKEIDKEKLKEIESAVEEFILYEVDRVCDQLDANLDKDRLDTVNKFRRDIVSMLVGNEMEVKQKFMDLKNTRSLAAMGFYPSNAKSNRRNSIFKEKFSEIPA